MPSLTVMKSFCSMIRSSSSIMSEYFQISLLIVSSCLCLLRRHLEPLQVFVEDVPVDQDIPVNPIECPCPVGQLQQLLVLHTVDDLRILVPQVLPAEDFGFFGRIAYHLFLSHCCSFSFMTCSFRCDDLEQTKKAGPSCLVLRRTRFRVQNYVGFTCKNKDEKTEKIRFSNHSEIP